MGNERGKWLIVDNYYINLDHVSMICVDEQDGEIKVTFFDAKGMILHQTSFERSGLQRFYQVMAYLTHAIPLGVVTGTALPT